MSAKIIKLGDLDKFKNCKSNTLKIFDNLIIDFLDDFSKNLKNIKSIYSYPDLVYLIFWTSRTNILKFKSRYKEESLRVGRGLAFHICPSNVPTNFIYSFFFGLISGNSNVVKLPSTDFIEKKIILKIIKILFTKKKYLEIKKSNFFLKFDSKSSLTEQISSIADVRIIWGGDKTVNEIRKYPILERAIDVTFPDRYSLCIINNNEFKKLTKKQITILANKFFYDSYSMNQAACNSPDWVLWIGKQNLKLENLFWQELDKIVENKFPFKEIDALNKYSKLVENIIEQKNLNKLKLYKNNLYVINPNKDINNIENIRGLNGIFYQKNIKFLSELKKFITKKCQTITYYGYELEDLSKFILDNKILGVDRFVPIGKALEIDINWDGYDVINSLSRLIALKK